MQCMEPPQTPDPVEPPVRPVVGKAPQEQSERDLRDHRPGVRPGPLARAPSSTATTKPTIPTVMGMAIGRPTPPIRIPCPMSLNDWRSRNSDQPGTAGTAYSRPSTTRKVAVDTTNAQIGVLSSLANPHQAATSDPTMTTGQTAYRTVDRARPRDVELMIWIVAQAVDAATGLAPLLLASFPGVWTQEVDMGDITQADIDLLQKRVQGDVCSPGDAGYDEAVNIWNARHRAAPGGRRQLHEQRRRRGGAGVRRSAGSLEVSVRGGGHNYAGFALSDDGLMIDLTPMKSVTVDPATPAGDVRRRHDLGRARRRHPGARAGGARRLRQPHRCRRADAWRRPRLAVAARRSVLATTSSVPRSSPPTGRCCAPRRARTPICSGRFAAVAATSAS